LNQALMILLPKSTEAPGIKDPGTQTARASAQKPQRVHGLPLQDNFQFVRSAAKLLHARQQACLLLKVDVAKACLLLKVDVAKAFDSPGRSSWRCSSLSASR
jgi:hypothetical protein